MAATKVPLDTVLGRIGIGWFQIRLWWICGFGFSAAALEVVLLAFVFPELKLAPWALTEWQLATLSAMISCGSIFGETILGAMADQYGRRNIFMITVIIVLVFGVASAFATSHRWLAALRFCVGFGYGGNIAVDFTLYSEFLPTEGRGNMLFLLTLFWPIGQILAAVLAWVCIPTWGWRVYVVVCAVPSLITAFARPFIPESPRWLLTQGRVEEATQICRDICKLNGKTPESIGLDGLSEVCLENEVSSLVSSASPPPREVKKQHTVSTSLETIFGGPLLLTTTAMLIIITSLNFTSYGTNTLMPRILDFKGIRQSSIYLSMVLNAAGQIPGVLVATWLSAKIGRLIPFRAAMLLTGVCLFGFAFAKVTAHVVACTMFASSFLEGGWALYHVYVAEVYPTDCRAFATGLLSAFGSMVAMLGPIISAPLMESRNTIQAVLAFSCCSMFAGVSACILLNIETKDRDLVDVSHALKSGSKDPDSAAHGLVAPTVSSC